MYTYKIWDKKSPINGVAAKEVLKIHGITDGEVGLVLAADGKVAVLQYDNANPLTKADLTARLKALTGQMNMPPEAEESTEADASADEAGKGENK